MNLLFKTNFTAMTEAARLNFVDKESLCMQLLGTVKLEQIKVAKKSLENLCKVLVEHTEESIRLSKKRIYEIQGFTAQTFQKIFESKRL
jgi:hypothetical protein